ncbi:MAG: trypsin-like peptidase domain-containing protein [Myxococcales bacterium]|nr:trypsin-like peptidase domain-containing protein [Myxococcales bacterium]
MRSTSRSRLLGLLGLGLLGCVADVGSISQPGIYGTDDRVELFETSDPLLQEIGRRAVAALVDRRFVDDDTGELRTITLDQRIEGQFGVPMCDDQPHRTQPAVAYCTGVLIDDDLLLTAAHCVPTQDYCDDLRIVFDYHYAREGVLETIGPEDVYRCREIAVISYLRDQAILRLDRLVDPPHRPATVRRGTGRLRAGDRLSVLSHGLGLPLKVDDNGAAGPAYTDGIDTFFFAADVFSGSSGAPILDNRGEIVGVVSRGQPTDVDNGRNCRKIYQWRAGSEPSEIASYVYRTMHHLCEDDGPGSARLCRDPGAWCPECASGGCAVGGPVGGGLFLFALSLVFALPRRR